jgi:hypothetical protein
MLSIEQAIESPLVFTMKSKYWEYTELIAPININRNSNFFMTGELGVTLQQVKPFRKQSQIILCWMRYVF